MIPDVWVCGSPLLRHQFCPISKQPGTDGSPLYLCASATSANPRRVLSQEKKKDPDQRSGMRAAPGDRAASFFNKEDCCRGALQVQSVIAGSLLPMGKRKITSWAQQAAISFPGMQDSINTLPPNVSAYDRVYATTLVVPHTCQMNVPQVLPEEVLPADYESSIPSSAAGMQFRQVKAGVRGSQYVTLLTVKYQESKRSWTVKRVLEEMQNIEPAARYSMAKWVISELRGISAVPKQDEMLLLQGLSSFLMKQGFGVIVFMCDAQSVRSQIYAQSKNKLERLERAAVKAGRTAKAVPFKPTDLSKLTDRYEDKESGEFYNVYVVSS